MQFKGRAKFEVSATPLLSAVVLSFVLVILFGSSLALAAASPHGGYATGASGTATDFCLTCHDVHQAAGDYVLMRDPSVTATCGTCHGLYGTAAGNSWTGGASDIWDSATQATVSAYSAYKNVPAVSGHRLGVALNGVAGRVDATIPGSSLGMLKVIASHDYYPTSHDGAGGHGIYNDELVTDFEATNGLYCASCHTPHGSIVGVDNLLQDGSPGQDGIDDGPGADSWGANQLVTQDIAATYPSRVAASRLLSNKPNHADTPVTSYNGFCISCHDAQDDVSWDPTSGTAPHNHPPYCTSCHGAGGGSLTPDATKDYPHTSLNEDLMSGVGDESCTGCHNSTNGLP